MVWIALAQVVADSVVLLVVGQTMGMVGTEVPTMMAMEGVAMGMEEAIIQIKMILKYSII